jgi:hypothetical protein
MEKGNFGSEKNHHPAFCNHQISSSVPAGVEKNRQGETGKISELGSAALVGQKVGSGLVGKEVLVVKAEPGKAESWQGKMARVIRHEGGKVLLDRDGCVFRVWVGEDSVR